MTKIKTVLPGLCVASAVAAVAFVLGRLFPIVGGPVFGILLGIVVGAVVPAVRKDRFSEGFTFSSKKVLQTSIVILGLGLSLGQVMNVGGSTFPVMIGTLVVALVGAALVGRWMKLDRELITLIGVGTAICGASAIAAVAAAIKPKQAHIAYALGTIFVFNIAAVLVFPALGHGMGMDGAAFGLWAGTAINDTSSVVAAAASFGNGSEPYAVVVKLVRALMIVPIVLVLARMAHKQHSADEKVRARDFVPMFIVLFLVASALRTIGLVPAAWQDGISAVAVFLITTALAAIGLSMRPAQLRAAGVKPLLLGGVLWALVATSSLGLQVLTGTL